MASTISLDNAPLRVVVRSRSKTFYKGGAKFVTSSNKVGVFDVLPHHANFITKVSGFVTVAKPDGNKEKYEVKTGVMRVFENRVDVYLTVS